MDGGAGGAVRSPWRQRLREVCCQELLGTCCVAPARAWLELAQWSWARWLPSPRGAAGRCCGGDDGTPDDDGAGLPPKYCSRLFQGSGKAELEGLSAAYMRSRLLDEVVDAGLDRSATVYEIEPSVIRPRGASTRCPRDGRLGAAYVDCLADGVESGPATFMLSYSWSYSIGDIVDCVVQFCADSGRAENEVFVWICCLCVNQHRVREAAEEGETVPFADFERAFGERVRGIGHVVAMMSPWRSPKYIERIWCNFEMFTALSVGEDCCRVSIVMPPRESESLEAALLAGSGLSEVWRTLAALRAELAQASVEADRERIFCMISDPPGPGFHKLNAMIAKHLQAWFVKAASGCLLRRLEAGRLDAELAAKLCAQVGELLMRVGLLGQAKELLDKACEICEEAGILESVQCVHLLRTLGIVTRESGCFEDAQKTLLRAKNICFSAGTLETVDGASLLSSLGFVKYEQGCLDGALELYMQARTIRERTGSLRTQDGALLMRNVGVAKHMRGEHDGALEAYAEARAIHEHLGTLVTPAGALLLTSIGTVKRERGDIDCALELYHEAKRIRERTGTLESPYGADLLRLIGIVQREQGEINSALELYALAETIRKATKTLETPDGASLLVSIGYARYELGEFSAALELYAQARHIREAKGVFWTPDGVLLCRNVGAVRAAMGDNVAAMRAFAEAMQIHESLGTLKTPLGAWLLTSIGVAKLQHGNFRGALDLFLQAKEIRELTETIGTQWGHELLQLVDRATAGISADGSDCSSEVSPLSLQKFMRSMSDVCPSSCPSRTISRFCESGELGPQQVRESGCTTTGVDDFLQSMSDVCPSSCPSRTISRVGESGELDRQYAREGRRMMTGFDDLHGMAVPESECMMASLDDLSGMPMSGEQQ